jgi:hypothetical protein
LKHRTQPERHLTGGSADLLTQEESQRYELPMSASWYQRKRWLRNTALKSGTITADTLADEFGPPFIKVGSRVFYLRSELRAFASRHKIGGTTIAAAVQGASEA